MQKVELKTAYFWWCEECGEVNFALPKKAELTEDGKEEAYREYHGLSPWDELPDGWQDFELVMIPETVHCQKCGREFATYDERSADADD
jgi:hypothetical protein